MTFHADPHLAPELNVDRTVTWRDHLFCRWVADFALLDAHRQKLHRLSRLDGQLAFAVQATPVEHHVRVQSMSTSHSRNACARLQGLLHNQPLLSSRATLPYLPDQQPRSFHQLIVRPASAHAPDGKTKRLQTKAAAVDTGHAMKKVAKKAAHKTKVAARKTKNGTENLGDKIAGKPETH